MQIAVSCGGLPRVSRFFRRRVTFALPMKGVRFHFAERPTYREPVSVSPVQDDPIALTAPLRRNDIVELRIYKNDAPLLKCCIKEPNRRSDRAFFLALCRIANPQVLYCMTVHDPAEQQLSLFMENGPVGAIESIVGIPSADETVKGFCSSPMDGFASADPSTLIIASRVDFANCS